VRKGSCFGSTTAVTGLSVVKRHLKIDKHILKIATINIMSRKSLENMSMTTAVMLNLKIVTQSIKVLQYSVFNISFLFPNLNI